MKRSTQEAEALLDSLVRASRTVPTASQAARLEQKLSPWLAGKSPLGLLRSRAAAKAMLVVVGLGLVTYSDESSLEVAKRDARTWPPTPRTVDHHEAPTAPVRAPIERPSAAVREAVPVLTISNAKDLPDANHAAKAKRPAKLKPVEAPEHVADGPLASPSVEQDGTTAGATDLAPPASKAAASREPEVDFLRRAQATLANAPSVALEMAAEHPSLYPRGVLAQEREVIAIDALGRLGRRAEAAARAAAFRSTFPRSAYLSRVAALTEKP